MNKSILIVDDEQSILQLLREAFELADYTVYTAANADEALEAFKGNVIPILILDIVMPNMSGIQLCRKIRQISPLPVIMALTGNYKLFEVTECRAAGFDDYFRKPVDLGELIATVNEAHKRVERWFSK